MMEPAKQLMTKFESEKGIQIKHEPLPDGWETKTVAAMAAGTAADVIWGWGPHMRRFIEKDGTLNLTPYISKDFSQEVIQDFVPSQWKSLQWKGNQHGLPQYCGIWGAYYNKRIFDEAKLPYPTGDLTAPQYLEIVQKLTKRDASGKAEQLGLDTLFSLEFTLSTAIWSWGGEVADPEGHVSKLHEPIPMEVLEWIADLRWKHKVVGSPAEYQSMKTVGWGLFATDKVAIKDDGSWAINVWLETVGNKFEWGVFPHWQGPTGKRETFHTTDTWVVYNKTKVPDAAWEWIKYTTDMEWQRMQMNTRLIQPARQSLGGEWIGLVKKKAASVNPALENLDLQIFIDGFKYARPMFQFAEHTKAMEILKPVFDQIYETGKGSVKDLIPEASKKVTDAMASS